MTSLPPATEFHAVLSDAESGSEEAIKKLVDSFTPHIERVLRHRMSGALRQRVGLSDVIQATWASFLLRENGLLGFDSEDNLRAFVTTVAINKMRMATRTHFHAQGRDVRRERTLDAAASDLPSTNDPTASEVAMFREHWNAVVDQQPEHYRRIVGMRLAGHKHTEIAEALRINEKTVRRVLKKFADAITDDVHEDKRSK